MYISKLKSPLNDLCNNSLYNLYVVRNVLVQKGSGRLRPTFSEQLVFAMLTELNRD